MNTIDSNAAANLLPMNPSRLVDAPAHGIGHAHQSTAPPRMADQATWSPGLWWLLYRYEYLFDGILPQPDGQNTVISEKPDQASDGTPLASAMPHWDQRQAVNPPPALATMPPAAEDIPAAGESPVNQPVSVGAFVDLIA